MISRIFLRVSGATSGRSLMTRETVWVETPASFATCFIVILRFCGIIMLAFPLSFTFLILASFMGFVNMPARAFHPARWMADLQRPWAGWRGLGTCAQ